jgi:hypothetical protein
MGAVNQTPPGSQPDVLTDDDVAFPVGRKKLN